MWGGSEVAGELRVTTATCEATWATALGHKIGLSTLHAVVAARRALRFNTGTHRQRETKGGVGHRARSVSAGTRSGGACTVVTGTTDRPT